MTTLNISTNDMTAIKETQKKLLISNDMIFDKLFEIEPRIKYENWVHRFQ